MTSLAFAAAPVHAASQTPLQQQWLPVQSATALTTSLRRDTSLRVLYVEPEPWARSLLVRSSEKMTHLVDAVNAAAREAGLHEGSHYEAIAVSLEDAAEQPLVPFLAWLTDEARWNVLLGTATPDSVPAVAPMTVRLPTGRARGAAGTRPSAQKLQRHLVATAN